MPFVLDASVTLAWLLEETQQAEYVSNALARLGSETAIVPSIWPAEVANSLLVAQRRGRISAELLTQGIAAILALPIDVQQSSLEGTLLGLRDLARRENLSVYDASYLDLAMREGLALATLDQALMAAAVRVGVTLLA